MSGAAADNLPNMEINILNLINMHTMRTPFEPSNSFDGSFNRVSTAFILLYVYM